MTTNEKNKEDIKKTLYASVVDSSIYVMVWTNLDIIDVVGVVSMFLFNSNKDHWLIVSWILIYLRGIFKVCLCIGGGQHALDDYIYAYMKGVLDCWKFIFGYMIFLQRKWLSKLQKLVVLSTTDIAATEVSKELLSMKKFLQELGFN